jgi:hypothetical protein
MGAGSYMMWAWPSQPVFLDPRIELYPTDMWRDAFTLEAGGRVDELASRYHFDGFLLDKHTDRGLLDVMKHRPDFRLLYEDADSTYFERAISP